MFGLLWLVMVRMLRFLEIPSSGQRVTWLTNPLRFYNFNILDNYNNNAGEVKHVAGGGSDVNELQTQSTANKQLQQHENEFALQADYNSNCSYPENSTTCTDTETGNKKRRRGEEQNQTTVEISHMSTTSSNDEESLTTNDVSDYQWFPDYGYGDNSNATNISQSYHRPSIFSMLSYSSDVHELNYEAISRNIDANLAEIDMEDFRSEDINSILAFPAMYCGASEFHSSGSHGEQAASLSASIMANFEDEGSTSTDFYHNNQHLSISINSDSTDMSVCKSEQLFSPIKESDAVGENGQRENNGPTHRHNPNGAGIYEAGAAPHPTTFSMDSLDCDSYDEQELILTCQTNVDNYTIAFEGSVSRDSEDSDYHDEAVVCETSDTESWSNQNLYPKKLPNFKLRNSDSVDGSLVQSDFVYTTWTKLKHGAISPQPSSANKRCHQKYPSRLNRIPSVTIPCNKSQSLPNLCRKYNPLTSFKLSQLNISTTESILEQSQRCVPLYDITSSTTSPNCSLQSLSLMRLFMQNRTNSCSSCSSSTGTGVFGSITHSLSSGTLQQQTEATHSQFDSNNLSERLQNYLGSKMGAGNEVPKKRPVSPLGSPIEEVDESDNTTTTTSNKMTINTIKNKNSDDSIEEDTGSENELEHDGAKIPLAAIDVTQGTQTSAICNISNAVVNDDGHKVRRGDSGVSLSSACTSYGDAKSEKCVKIKSGKNVEKSGSVTITMFTTRGTQLPVHVCDEAIQTSCKGEWLERILSKCSKLPSNTQITVSEETIDVGNDKLEGEENEENQTQSTIYVCYPNYSLPDLSFLKELSKEKPPPKVHLSPNKTPLQNKKNNNNAVRPKSCPGFNHLHPNVNNLTRIEDWDSLNVLLPQNVKELIRNWKTTEIFGDENPSMSKRSSESSSQEKSDLEKVPRGILRRSRTESGPVDIKRFVVPKELHTLYTQMHADAITAEKALKQGPAGSCKCPLSGELTALLGISQEQCDCEHSLKSTLNLGTLENQFSDIDLQDDVKNKKVVSFSSKNQTCFSCESQAENFAIKFTEVETAEIKDIPKIKFSSSGKDDGLEMVEASLKKVPSWDSKLELVNGVTDAVNILNHHFSLANDPHSKILMGSTLHTPSTGHKVLQFLCPALFQILNDGLQPSIYNIFGHMENSVWMVIEALTQSCNCSKQMSDLIVHVNNEQNILEKRKKFNAFIFGLLNIRSLATWFSLLGSSEQILSKHYSPSAFLYRAVDNRKMLFDNLLIAFQTLSLLPFDLDLAFELHLSNPLSPTQPQRICFSSSPSKHNLPADPYVPEEKLKCEPIKTSKLVHRHSCGLLLDELIKEQTDSGTPEAKERKFDRLRRGLSQDSAVAKQVSESTHIPNASSRSSEEQHREGWALRDLPKRPWSYAQEVEFDSELSSQNSSKEMCSNSSGANTDSSSIELLREVELKEKADGGQSEPKSLIGEAEKGSLDARISERKENATDKSECKIALGNEKEALEDPDSVQFKQLQMRWEILSGASPLNPDKKKVSNPNSRSRIPRLVMQLPTSPSPKLKQRIEKQLSNEQLLQPVTIAVNSNCPAPHSAIVQISRTSLGQHGSTHPEPNVHAKNIAAAAASSEKSPVKRRSNVGIASTKTKAKAGNGGICKGASGGTSDDTAVN